MKSPDPLDSTRLNVTGAYVNARDPDDIEVTVTFSYRPWEPSPAQDILWEQANALTCVRKALVRGGVGDE